MTLVSPARLEHLGEVSCMHVIVKFHHNWGSSLLVSDGPADISGLPALGPGGGGVRGEASRATRRSARRRREWLAKKPPPLLGAHGLPRRDQGAGPGEDVGGGAGTGVAGGEGVGR